MFKVFQEADLPKLSQTSIYSKYDQASHITQSVKEELGNIKDTMVRPAMIPEMISLMKLNGDPIVKKAIDAYEKNEIIVIFNPQTSKIPSTLPFIIVNQGGSPKCFMFADKVCTKLNNQTEYTNFMATLEASYLALSLYKNPNKFISNRNVMITLCNLYTIMATAPLEQRLYMKGDNLVKAMMYIITYFYRIIDGDRMTPESIPYKRIISDKVDNSTIKLIVSEIKALPDLGFFNILGLIKNINPVRYKNLDNMYLTYFTSSCGIPLIFALENLSYVFLLMTSSVYKTPVTQYGLNKTVATTARKLLKELNQMGV